MVSLDAVANDPKERQYVWCREGRLLTAAVINGGQCDVGRLRQAGLEGLF